MRPIFKRGLPARLIRFRVGQRVRIVGSDPPRFDRIKEVVEHGRHVRYRLVDSPFRYAPGDLTEASPLDRWSRELDYDNPQRRPGESAMEFTGRMLGERRDV